MPVRIATVVPGLINKHPRTVELLIQELDKCDYFVLDREAYIRGIQDPALARLQHKTIIFVHRPFGQNLYNVDCLRAVAKRDPHLARLLNTTLVSKEVVILDEDFFGFIEDYATYEQELKYSEDRIKEKLNRIQII